MTGTLTHFDAAGRAAMVDVSAKPETTRSATARARVVMQAETLALITTGTAKKGDVLGVARIAGIMAAKRTAELIPLCHPLPIDAVGLELTAASVAALTVYDMCKAVDRGMRIEAIRLTAKDGGKSGTFRQD